MHNLTTGRTKDRIFSAVLGFSGACLFGSSSPLRAELAKKLPVTESTAGSVSTNAEFSRKIDSEFDIRELTSQFRLPKESIAQLRVMAKGPGGIICIGKSTSADGKEFIALLDSAGKRAWRQNFSELGVDTKNEKITDAFVGNQGEVVIASTVFDASSKQGAFKLRFISPRAKAVTSTSQFAYGTLAIKATAADPFPFARVAPEVSVLGYSQGSILIGTNGGLLKMNPKTGVTDSVFAFKGNARCNAWNLNNGICYCAFSFKEKNQIAVIDPSNGNRTQLKAQDTGNTFTHITSVGSKLLVSDDGPNPATLHVLNSKTGKDIFSKIQMNPGLEIINMGGNNNELTVNCWNPDKTLGDYETIHVNASTGKAISTSTFISTRPAVGVVSEPIFLSDDDVVVIERRANKSSFSLTEDIGGTLGLSADIFEAPLSGSSSCIGRVFVNNAVSGGVFFVFQPNGNDEELIAITPKSKDVASISN